MEPSEKFRILIVDDSEFARANMSKMLPSEKYSIIGEASNAKEAINILKSTKAHLAILDVVMPDVSGIELASQISTHFKETAIMMVSSLAGESIIIDSISAGASDYLQKPFKQEDFLASIEKILERFEGEI